MLIATGYIASKKQKIDLWVTWVKRQEKNSWVRWPVTVPHRSPYGLSLTSAESWRKWFTCVAFVPPTTHIPISGQD
jgi:hypothetical protein